MPTLVSGIKWDNYAYRKSEYYAALVDKIYRKLAKEYINLGLSVGYTDPDKPFSFDDYPGLKKRAAVLFNNFNTNLKQIIWQGAQDAYSTSNSKSEALISELGKSGRLSNAQVKFYKENGLSQAATAFDAFTKEDFSAISDRVWDIAGQFSQEIQSSIGLGLKDGLSADEMTRMVRQYLNEPDRLFRRVRDEYGNLRQSKAALNYHPGQGVYKSSYKNAMRLARTEINMAYRNADFDRWSNLDFVAGYEIHLSNNPHHCPVCAQLAGKYPKTFKWRGWHPQCRCYMLPILISDADFDKLELMQLNGDDTDVFKPANEVMDLPEGMGNFIVDNKGKIIAAKKKPFFIQDNRKVLKSFESGKEITAAIKELFRPAERNAYMSFVPFSATIMQKLQQLASEKAKQALLADITQYDGFEEIQSFGDSVTMKHPLHNTGSGGWKNELSMSMAINKNGQSVWLLPENDNISNADAITIISGKYQLADFKHIKSVNPSQIADGIMQAFKQGGNAVVRLENADLGQFRDAIEEVKRKLPKRQIGNIKIVTTKGKIIDLSEKDINSSRYLRTLKGKL